MTAINLPPKFPFWGKVLTILAIGICLIYLLSGCSCEALQKRLERKCGQINYDTLIVKDTIVTNTIKRDTVFKYYTRDTVVVREGRLVMKYFYNSHDSTVYLNGNCKGDTIYIEKKVPYKKTVVKIDYFPKWLMWVVIVLAIVAILLRVFFGKYSK